MLNSEASSIERLWT